MFNVGDLVFAYSGYVGIITEISNPHRYPYKVLFISYPREDDYEFEDTEWCREDEIKHLEEMNLDSIG